MLYPDRNDLKLSISVEALFCFIQQPPDKVARRRAYGCPPDGLRTGSPPFPSPRLIRLSCGFSCGPGAFGSRSPTLALKAYSPSGPLQNSSRLRRFFGVQGFHLGYFLELGQKLRMVLSEVFDDPRIVEELGQPSFC